VDVTELRPSIPIPSPVTTPMTQHFAVAMCLALTIQATAARAAPPSPPERPRLIVLTDMRSLTAGVAEPDDGQSLIRLMLYADEFDIEGMVASSNLGHGQRVRPELILRVVDASQNVRPNLLVHDPRPPPALAWSSGHDAEVVGRVGVSPIVE